MQWPLAAAWAGPADFLPSALCLQNGWPKGETPALSWAEFIDQAFSGQGVEKDAITVGLFDETFRFPSGADKPLFEFRRGESEELRKGLDLFLVHIDISRLTGTTVPTTGTFKPQAFMVPGQGRFFAHALHSQRFFSAGTTLDLGQHE